MKMKSPYFLIIICLLFSLSVKAVPTPTSSPTKVNTIDKSTLEKQLGRKLKWSERIALRLVNKRSKKKAILTGSPTGEKSDGFAVAGFISGLGTIILFAAMGYGVSIIAGIVAIILSAIGMHRTQGLKGFKKKGRGLAIAGLVIGIISTAFWLLVFAALTGIFIF